MRAVSRLREKLQQNLEGIHAKRLEAVFASVDAAFSASHVGLVALGRAMRGTAKHSIKRVDRLLGNPHLVREQQRFYRALGHFVLGRTREPLVLVDWTPITEDFYALVAAAKVDGRSVPLYAEVHPRGQDGNPKVELPFLESLRAVLPKHCAPIVVADAGFRTAWMKRVRSYGWNFVVRLRGAMCVQLPSKAWIAGASLRDMARCKAKRIDRCVVAKSSPTEVSVVLWDGRSKGARRSQPKARRKRAEANARLAREPWALATSLRRSPRAIVSMYQSRMQIEEMFRDAKCGRFGLGLGMTLSYKPGRLAALLLITSLTLVAAMLVGLAGYRRNLQRKFQANTRNVRVLGLARLGVFIMRDPTLNASFTTEDVHALQLRVVSP